MVNTLTMSNALVDTVFQITGKNNIEDISKTDFENIANQYPYFAPAHLLYVAKLKAENSDNVKEQTQKAGLFFNNSRWFQYQIFELQNLKNKSVENYKEVQLVNEPIEIEEIQNEPIVENVNEVKVVHELNIEVDEVLEQEIMPQEILQELEIKTESKTPIKEEVDAELIRQFREELKLEKPTSKTPTPIFEDNKIQSSKLNQHQFIPNFSIPTVEHIKGIYSGIDKRTAKFVEIVEAQNNIEETIDVNSNIEDKIEEAVQTELIITPKVEEPIIVKSIIDEPVKEVTSTINLRVENMKSEWEKPLDALEENLLPFEKEPYYTIDYFASQGIKFDYNKEPHDKLTTKMLKFTDWLKKMKAIQPEGYVYEEDPELNNTIQNIAAISNETREIVTETMAEVFTKQGKTDKAIQLYIKLSFLIPHKSTYFASKINELKGI